jgi:hypothetical protein
MVYSLSDIYPFSSRTETTTGQTQPDVQESESYNDKVVETAKGNVVINKNMIFGGLGLMVAVLVALHFLGGE